MKNEIEKPKTVENRWDILYRDYPEVYDEFVSIPRKPQVSEVINKMFNLKDRVILDIGSGTGLSTFGLAPYVEQVIGLEPEDSMLKMAVGRLNRIQIGNAEFIKGRAEDIPVKDCSVDGVIAITGGPGPWPDAIRRYIKDATRVVRDGGFMAIVGLPPKGWYGGELAPIIVDRTETPGEERIHPYHDILPREFNFKHKDFFQVQDYGSVAKIVAVYGFIYGREAIDYLRKHNKTTIKWKFRIYYRML